jgi:hypothetical protein
MAQVLLITCDGNFSKMAPIMRLLGLSLLIVCAWFFFGLEFFFTFFWLCVLVDDIEYGRGSGSDKGTAKETAAGVALRQLQGQLANLSN